MRTSGFHLIHHAGRGGKSLGMVGSPAPACLALLLALSLALPGVALADPTAIYGGSPSKLTVGITVRASVATACGFTPGATPSGDRNLGDLTHAFSADFPFTLRCNTPARVGVTSLNGGLRAAGAPVQPGFTATAPYQVELKLVGDEATAAETCAAAALTPASPSACGIRGPATASAGLRLSGVSQDTAGSYLRITGGQAGPEPLTASAGYNDRLTVTISPTT